MINGSYLRTLRKSHGYTLIQLSEELDCTASFLSQLERGQKEPSLNTLRKLSEVLGVPMASFFLPDESTTPLVCSNAYILTRRENRPMLSPVPGVRCEVLTPNPSTDSFLPIYALHFTLPPHTAYLEEITMRKNDAVICPMEGDLHAVFENEEVVLHPGDCLYIHTGVLHNLVNRSDMPCEFHIFCN